MARGLTAKDWARYTQRCDKRRSDQLNECYRQGQKARRDGKAMSENPYSSYGWRSAFERGWKAADDELMAAKPEPDPPAAAPIPRKPKFVEQQERAFAAGREARRQGIMRNPYPVSSDLRSAWMAGNCGSESWQPYEVAA